MSLGYILRSRTWQLYVRLFSEVATPFYIPTSSVVGSFLPNTCCYPSFYYSCTREYGVAPYFGFDLHLPGH